MLLALVQTVPFFYKLFESQPSTSQALESASLATSVSKDLRYNGLVFRYSPVTPADFDSKHFELQTAREKLSKQGHSNTYHFSWWRCVSLSTLTATKTNPASPFTSPSSIILVLRKGLSDNSDEAMVCFPHDAGPTVYRGLFGSRRVSNDALHSPYFASLLEWCKRHVAHFGKIGA